MFKNLFKKTVLIIFFGLLTGVVSVFTLYLYIEKDLPNITSLDDYQPNIPSVIYDRNGKVLKEYGKENRAIVKIEDVPRRIINSFLAAEDSGFYHHFGVDPFGIARAFIANLKAGRVVQGGSTITQQVAKSFLKSKERSIVRKVKDIFLAYKIEQHLTKDEILFLYLNQVYLGGGYYGIKEAFKGYFGKELEEVSIAESAMVAGLLVAPSRYSPYSNPKFAYMRQGYVLKRLLSDNLISELEYNQALSESIKYQQRKGSDQIGFHFVEFIRKEVVKRLGEDRLLRGGLKIRTTLDLELQRQSEQSLNQGVLDIDKRQGFTKVIKNLKSEEEIQKYLEESKLKFKEKHSSFFVIDKDFNRRLELDGIFESPDLFGSDVFTKALRESEFVEVIVTNVSDSEGIVQVSYLGQQGFIDLDNMSWARTRDLKSSRNWKQPLTSPSEILKKGDVIYASYLGDSINGFSNELKVKNEENAVPQIHFALFQKPIVQAASITLNPFNGEILSLVGGNKYNSTYFNRAIQSKRQPGSALKPFVYALGLENGFTNSTILYDTPESLSAGSADFNWKPRNYDGKYMGPITFRRSLELSRNVTTIKIASELGVDNLIKFFDRIGLEGEYNNDLSTSLGSGAISLENLTLGYSIFVNGGYKNTSKYILGINDYLGNNYKADFEDIHVEENSVSEIFEELDKASKPEKPTVYEAKNAFLMKSLLKGVVKNGTGKKAKSISPYLGGKTGTTSDYNDAWFVGFNSKVITGVWVGFDDNKTLGWPESGSKAALPIWMDIMKSSIKLYPEEDVTMPDGIVNVLIDPKTGKLASASTRKPFLEVFSEGTEPGGLGDNNYGQESKTDEQAAPQPVDDFYDLR